MYINFVSHYLPVNIIHNKYFEALNGLSNDWIVGRTGIKERRKASFHENTNTMAVDAVRSGLNHIPYSKNKINLIVGATYTPYDTIVSLGHSVQRFLELKDIPVVSITSACSSLINAIEIVQGYFALSKADTSLIVASEHNSRYSDEKDQSSGHLWGDGATAMFVSKYRTSDNDLHIVDVITGGAGDLEMANEAIVMQPGNGGLIMNNGKDIFAKACYYLETVTRKILSQNNLDIKDINHFIPHQANLRIIKNVGKALGLPEKKMVLNIDVLGNTGCAGCGIALSQHMRTFNEGDYIIVAVFGGGYSYGAMLLRKEKKESESNLKDTVETDKMIY